VLTARVADDGRFIDARFTPTVQIRPGGPQPDPEKRALIQLRDLTAEAFPAGSLTFSNEGAIARKHQEPVRAAGSWPIAAAEPR
jgi:hypothetical protein